MRATGSVLAFCLAVFAVIAGCEKKEAPRLNSTVRADRHVPLEGQPNFRDLGGYKTAGGQTVRSGQVYRSGELPRLTEADVKRLEELRIRTVVSFLTDIEIEARGPDRLPDGVRELSVPIKVGDNLAKQGLEARQTGDFSKLSPEINPEVHKILTAEAKAEYAALLREIAKTGNRPIVFHCSHGVHRTGTAAAILLWSLGVEWETIRADYLLSNEYRRDEVEKRLAQLRRLAAEKQAIDLEQVDMTNIHAFYVLRGEYIDATRDLILTEYGSIDAYLRQGLGLRDEDVARLRDELLE